MICGVIVLSLSFVFIISNRCSSWYFRLRCAVSESGEEKNILDKFVPVTFKRHGDQTKQSTVLFGVCSNHSSCVCVGTNWEHQVFARRTEHVDADRCLTDRTNRLITNKAKVWQNTKQITFFSHWVHIQVFIYRTRKHFLFHVETSELSEWSFWLWSLIWDD